MIIFSYCLSGSEAGSEAGAKKRRKKKREKKKKKNQKEKEEREEKRRDLTTLFLPGGGGISTITVYYIHGTTTVLPWAMTV